MCRLNAGHTKPVDMCLVDGSVTEIEPPSSTVGQLIIEDSRNRPQFSCSHTACCRDIGRVPPNGFKYYCQVDNPEDNYVTSHPVNVSQLFQLDSSFLLRTKVRLKSADYAHNNGTVRVHFSCYDLERPLHFIGKAFPVKVLGKIETLVVVVVVVVRFTAVFLHPNKQTIPSK